MKLAYILSDNGACGHYRMDLPIKTMAGKEGIEHMVIEKGDPSEKIETALTADVIVIPRLGDEKWLNLLPALKGFGKKIVIDHDDNMFKVSPFSPHYEDSGTEEFFFNLDGKHIPVWFDINSPKRQKYEEQGARAIDITENKRRAGLFKKAMRESHMVSVTTEILADVYRKYNDNVVVLPNCVDTNIWKRLPLKRESDEIRMGWFGGSSHYEDWCILSKVLPVVMERHKNLKLVIMGVQFKGTTKYIDQSRIEFHKWVHTQAYPYKSAILDIDFSVIPLVENAFNVCKSPIKWVEQGAMGIPCVSSYVSPYREVANGKNGIFIDGNDTDAWIEGISLLADDSLLRAKLGGEARKTVLEHYDINTQYHRWYQAYKGLMEE